MKIISNCALCEEKSLHMVANQSYQQCINCGYSTTVKLKGKKDEINLILNTEKQINICDIEKDDYVKQKLLTNVNLLSVWISHTTNRFIERTDFVQIKCPVAFMAKVSNTYIVRFMPCSFSKQMRSHALIMCGNHGAISSTARTDLKQMRIWNEEPTELILHIPAASQSDRKAEHEVIFLPGTLQEKEVGLEPGRHPEMALTFQLAEV